ncbi:hypothetical protein [Brevibacterium aurantiacum]|uniref:hypothetical protein n=1 Tax=Brevibacterium aurantiacum TaxID=273384 RepID=UPI000DF171E7|nr:hypothetical protein [Brevibacterium aurantiacum]RCS84244.1 hypothetical protein CIK63_18185 [Brevibacterium aurantiacum]
MNRKFTPLNGDAIHKNLVYVSSAKLEQLLLKKMKQGFNVTLPAQLGGAGHESRELATRELLESAIALFEKNQNLIYEEVPESGEWLMVRFLGKCGTAWPWSGGGDEFQNTAWWVGRSEKLKLLAYGHSSHVLGNGLMPAIDDKATWWPSTPGSYRKLLESVTTVVNADDLDAEVVPGSIQESAATFRGIDRFFFSDGVERGAPILQEGVYEMLLRVDGVEPGEGDNAPVVFGSPLWVAKVNWAVPGTYVVESISETRDVSIVASWDGQSWSDLHVRDQREPFMQVNDDNITLPSMPVDPPNVNHLIELEIQPNQDTGLSDDQPESNSIENEYWFARIWRRIFRK